MEALRGVHEQARGALQELPVVPAPRGNARHLGGAVMSPYVCPVDLAVQDWLAAEALRSVFG